MGPVIRPAPQQNGVTPVDIKSIDAAIEAYRLLLGEKDLKRLMFFCGLWEIQDSLGKAFAKEAGYTLPDLKEAEKWYWQEIPFLRRAPLSINKESFATALEEISSYLVRDAGLKPELSACLESFDWQELVDKSDMTLAGSDPVSYAQNFCALAEELSGSKLLPQTSFIVFGYAIRPFLELAASALLGSLSEAIEEGNLVHNKPLHCPVCGCDATAAFVGENRSREGRGNARQLYCGICGAVWEFERIRCAHCGTRNQKNLHYFHIEGDDSHRLHSCKECGDYIRTVFSEELKVAFSFEVEDVVMAHLDTVANDPRFVVNA